MQELNIYSSPEVTSAYLDFTSIFFAKNIKNKPKFDKIGDNHVSKTGC